MNVHPFSVHRAVHGDEAILRKLRLEAMLDSPESFGSTYERELGRTTADWSKWLSPGATFILNQPEPVGLVAAQIDPIDPEVVHLMAMWVHPSIRGGGGADLLVSALRAWAEHAGLRTVRLHVIKSNARARGFYERNGFRSTGHESERDGRIEVLMERPIA